MELLSERECELIIALAEGKMRIYSVCKKFGVDDCVIHRRLDRIKERTGLDGRIFYDLAKLVEMTRNQPW